MRWTVGGEAVSRGGALTSQMGRFETEVLATDANVEALTNMNGVWIDKVHDRHPPTKIILDMDSSVSPTHGDQEGSAYNGHFGCTCYHPLFLFNRGFASSNQLARRSECCDPPCSRVLAAAATRCHRRSKPIFQTWACGRLRSSLTVVTFVSVPLSR